MSQVGHYLITFGRSEDFAANLSAHLGALIGKGSILVMDNNPVAIDSSSLPAAATHIDIGRNIGPAGAARLAILLLAAQGCDMVIGGDDDRLGGNRDILEECHRTLVNLPADVAAVAAYGSDYSDRFFRQMKPTLLELDELSGEGRLLEVGVVGGGRPSVWRTEPFRHAGLHRPELFFGGEDFEVCRRLIESGYRILVVPRLMVPELRSEVAAMATGTMIGPLVAPWRRYYHSRNTTYLLSIERRLGRGLVVLASRVASIFVRPGIPNRLRPMLAWYELLGFVDGARRRMGERMSPRGYT